MLLCGWMFCSLCFHMDELFLIICNNICIVFMICFLFFIFFMLSMKQWYLLFIAYGNLWENATVFHNCISFVHLSSRTHTCSVFTLGFTFKLRVNSLGSVYLFGYWIFDLEMRKNKTICILIFHFCSNHWKQKVTKTAFDIGIKIPNQRYVYWTGFS